MMTRTEKDQLIADLNVAATLPPEGSPEFLRGKAALDRTKAGHKILDKSPGYVVILVEDQFMVKITHLPNGQYQAEEYDEYVG